MRCFIVAACGLGLLVTTPAQAQAPEAVAAARYQFAQGQERFVAMDYVAAAYHFQVADALAPAGLNDYNLGLCYERQGDLARARSHYEAYLRRVPDATNRDAVVATLARLPQAQHPPEAAVAPDGEAVRSAPPETPPPVVAASPREIPVPMPPANAADDAPAVVPVVRGPRGMPLDARTMTPLRPVIGQRNVAPAELPEPAAVVDLGAKEGRMPGPNAAALSDTVTEATSAVATAAPAAAVSKAPSAADDPANWPEPAEAFVASLDASRPAPVGIGGAAVPEAPSMARLQAIDLAQVRGAYQVAPYHPATDVSRPVASATPLHREWWFWGGLLVGGYLVYSLATPSNHALAR